jgi:hypothetical protein
MAPFSADVRKAVPLPQRFQDLRRGLHHVAQSIEIKYFQQGFFGENFNGCPPLLLACAAWVSNDKL